MNNYVSLKTAKKLNWQGKTEKVWIIIENKDPFIVTKGIYEYKTISFAYLNKIEIPAPSIAELLEELKGKFEELYYSETFEVWQVNSLAYDNYCNKELVEALAELYIKLKG